MAKKPGLGRGLESLLGEVRRDVDRERRHSGCQHRIKSEAEGEVHPTVEERCCHLEKRAGDRNRREDDQHADHDLGRRNYDDRHRGHQRRDEEHQETGERPGNVGRNSVRGPGFQRTDLSIFKNFTFATTQRIQVRIETFNLFNQVNYTNYGAVLTSRSFGLATAAAPARRFEMGMRVGF